MWKCIINWRRKILFEIIAISNKHILKAAFYKLKFVIIISHIYYKWHQIIWHLCESAYVPTVELICVGGNT